ncbi:MAG: hypothetical protein NTY64_08930, partial [Deltaproteobacteria bacterium]|nr:hypothetical protein [Deltaproteobacteria bacterium]
NLKPTRPERVGLVDREKLLAMSGRGRKPQIALAEQLGIRHYPSPAGGCLLTDPILAERIRKYFSQTPVIETDEVLLLQVGRHFNLPGGAHLVVGRKDLENQRLTQFSRKGDFQIQLKEIPGPLGLLRGGGDEASLKLAARIVARYSKAKDQANVAVQVSQDAETFDVTLVISPAIEEEVEPLRF